MIAYKQGDVVLVPFPFGERAGGKRRPGLVISSVEHNQATNEVVIAQITSRLSAPARPGDYRIEFWREANLPRAAIVRCRLASLPSSLVLRRLGEFAPSDFQGAREALSAVLFG